MAEHNRRYDIRGASSNKGPRKLELYETASVDQNLLFEQTTAQPNYQYSRSIAQNTTDTDPVAAPGSITDIWDLNGYHGMRGYVELVGVASVDIELWHYDPENDKWYRLATAISLGNRHGFDFSGKVRNGICFVRCATATGAGETVAIYATGE